MTYQDATRQGWRCLVQVAEPISDLDQSSRNGHPSSDERLSTIEISREQFAINWDTVPQDDGGAAQFEH